jgi:hypothetical protein
MASAATQQRNIVAILANDLGYRGKAPFLEKLKAHAN